jgi:hypothetical protein
MIEEQEFIPLEESAEFIESLEQIDELDTKTLQSYLMKAKRYVKKVFFNDYEKASEDEKKKLLKKIMGRNADIKTASTMIAKKKEETINEVLTVEDPIKKWIDDFVASDNPKFDGKSKNERVKMAIGAYYAATKKD